MRLRGVEHVIEDIGQAIVRTNASEINIRVRIDVAVEVERTDTTASVPEEYSVIRTVGDVVVAKSERPRGGINVYHVYVLLPIGGKVGQSAMLDGDIRPVLRHERDADTMNVAIADDGVRV